jgi:hypothetical protein
MKKKPSRTVPQEQAATREEVDQALEALSEVQQLRLRRFAGWRIRGLGRATLRRDADDLLGEAMTSTLAGADGLGEGRRWNKAVDFVKHLTEAMRSISDHWRRKFDEREAHLESELVTVDPVGEERSPLNSIRSDEPAADRALLAKEEVARIFAMFKEDDEAILVLQGWVEGMTGIEIMQLGFTKRQYEAAVKRIRYAVRERTGR